MKAKIKKYYFPVICLVMALVVMLVAVNTANSSLHDNILLILSFIAGILFMGGCAYLIALDVFKQPNKAK